MATQKGVGLVAVVLVPRTAIEAVPRSQTEGWVSLIGAHLFVYWELQRWQPLCRLPVGLRTDLTEETER